MHSNRPNSATEFMMDAKMTLPAESKCPADCAVTISIAETEAKVTDADNKQNSLRICLRTIGDKRKAVHAAKVGLALVLVSLLYMLEPVHDRLGDNAMWAIMTVVVVFEFTSGATISKGINRGIGTILGGGLGSLIALLAQESTGAGKAVVIGTAVFVFGVAGTYSRMVPSIKMKYDYGAMIFILTFTLVAVSGVRGDEIIKIATDRLSSICMGFAICVFISLFVFPVWSGCELHNSMASKFDNLACSIEECLEDQIKKIFDEKIGNQAVLNFTTCISVVSSKNSDETMARFAKWEPWHGRFGLYHPWNKYLQIGELLRQLATSIISMKGSLLSEKQLAAHCLAIRVGERYDTTYSLLAYTMRELGGSINKMARYRQGETVISKLRTIRLELRSSMPPSNVQSSLFLLVEIVDKVEELIRQVDELGKAAGYTPK